MQQESFEILTASIENEDLVRVWEEEVKAWEADPSRPDPYYVTVQGAYMLSYPSISYLTPDAGPTQTEIRRKIAEEESKESAQSGYTALHDVTPSGFVSEGLSIEEQQ